MTTKLKYMVGNVVDQQFKEPTLLIHVCNVCDGYGSGVAGAITKKYYHAKAEYHEWYNSTTSVVVQSHVERDNTDEINERLYEDYGDTQFMLGQIQVIEVVHNLFIVNMLAQVTPSGDTFKIGSEKVYLRPIRLSSLRECLYRVASLSKGLGAKVVGPMFASGLARGNWDEEIVPLIEECLLKFDIDVTIYKLQ